ncbi:MAG TPA: YihY/virulence factor BrkB family protein [Micromonosporaceae bacterium]
MARHDREPDTVAPPGQPRPVPPGPDAGPPGPLHLGGRPLWAAVRRAVKGIKADNLTDWAAALTYYGILSIFPGLLVLVAVLGWFGQSATSSVVENITKVAPGAVRSILTNVTQQHSGGSGIVAVISLVVAFWSASGYVAAFMRASNAIYDVPEGRPIWKTLPIRLGVTAVTGILLIVSAFIVVFTGRLASDLGDLIGLGSTATLIWQIAKWPVLVILVSVMFAILYWASPNARQGGFRWISPGGLLAVLLWLIASGLFAVYVANFSSYNRTYGALAGAIIFLVWLWISNLAVLLGAEVDAELERGRAIAAGFPADEEPYLRLRDTRKLRGDPDEARDQTRLG